MTTSLEPGSFRALIFDCDGTLVETVHAHIATLQAILTPYGLHPTVEWARGKYGVTPAKVLEAIETEIGHIPVPHSDVLRAWAEGYEHNLHLLEEIHAVCDVAREWHGRVPIAVASNGRRANVLATLDATGLRELFEAVVSIEDVQHGKPAPDLFLEAARKLGVAPADCVVFEDSAEGMEAARLAGMRVIFAPDVVAGCARVS